MEAEVNRAVRDGQHGGSTPVHPSLPPHRKLSQKADTYLH